jgi:hypothetical protein
MHASESVFLDYITTKSYPHLVPKLNYFDYVTWKLSSTDLTNFLRNIAASGVNGTIAVLSNDCFNDSLADDLFGYFKHYILNYNQIFIGFLVKKNLSCSQPYETFFDKFMAMLPEERVKDLIRYPATQNILKLNLFPVVKRSLLALVRNHLIELGNEISKPKLLFFSSIAVTKKETLVTYLDRIISLGNLDDIKKIIGQMVVDPKIEPKHYFFSPNTFVESLKKLAADDNPEITFEEHEIVISCRNK